MCCAGSTGLLWRSQARRPFCFCGQAHPRDMSQVLMHVWSNMSPETFRGFKVGVKRVISDDALLLAAAKRLIGACPEAYWALPPEHQPKLAALQYVTTRVLNKSPEEPAVT